MSGWLKLHRKITEWEWYSDTNVYRLFTHLLFIANYEETRWCGEVIMPGQCVTGRENLAKSTSLTPQQVRTCLDKLKSTNEITIKTTNKYSIITIVHWLIYQQDNQQDNQQTTNKQPTNNQQVTTPKEDKNLRTKESKKELLSEIEKDLFEDFWQAFPKQRIGSKQKAQSAWKSALTRAPQEKIYGSVKSYAASDEVARGFAKGAAAWLNDDRWNTDYSAIARPTGSIATGNANSDSQQNSGGNIEQPPSKWQIAGARVLGKIERGEI